MRKFTATGDRFYTPATILGGLETRLIIHPPSDKDNPSNTFLVPHYMGRVRTTSPVTAGQIIYLKSHRQHYILGLHSVKDDFRTLYMFPCHRLVRWERLNTIRDRITGLDAPQINPTNMGDIWVMWQRERREFTDLNMRVTQERYIVLTNADVKLRDKLDGASVDRIDVVYGLNVLEVQA